MNTGIKHIVLAGTVLMATAGYAIENIGKKYVKKNVVKAMASCNPATAQTDLDINNVRTTIMAGGDMWWNLNAAKYEIPKNGGKHSLYAGALWIGGIDAGGQLKVAAQTYRQGGNDFWPGPLDTVYASTSIENCEAFDKHFKITRQEVEEFYGWTKDPSNPSYAGYSIPKSILDWPAHGDPAKNQPYYLAPFYDNDGDGSYNPSAGDYPDYNVLGKEDCSSRLFGDQTLWWVVNDKGDIHTETNGQSIGLEIHSQAFGFQTNDEINNMTFYNYKVINRSSFQLNNTYFGQWVDADLGYHLDDYVGCDVGRGLGYCYNGKAVDGTGAPAHYGSNPPAVGVDFFQGPLADPNDGKDNDRDGVVDEVGEQIIMSKFVYYNNDFSITGNPTLATHFYNYLSGFWTDGSPFTYGGDAYQEAGPVCDFMFPGNSDPNGWGTNGAILNDTWDEVTAGNTAGDRRFLQSAGPFTLQPGAVNTITTGVVWARASSGGPMASVALMRLTDDKAQALFDNCFRVLNGPDAPDLTFQEMNNELVLYLTNKPTSNNYLEKYKEKDPLIVDLTDSLGKPITNYNKYYGFEGYQVYQLRDASVSQTDLEDPDKARLVAQFDVKNGVTQLVNFNFDESLNASVPEEMAKGEDEGILHSIKLTEDQFASGDKKLVNHKQYYYMAIAYAYNNYKTYNPNDPLALDGQKKPYKAGRKNIRVYTAIPHDPTFEAGGTEAHGAYNYGPKITRIEGNGNGGQVLELTQKSINDILTSPYSRALELTYENSAGPVNIRIVDPLSVPEADFELKFNVKKAPQTGLDTSTTWTLTNKTTGEVVESESSIGIFNEQLILKWGLAISIKQIALPGATNSVDNGLLDSYISFADPSKAWLAGLPDMEGSTPMNWIRSGTNSATLYGDYTIDNGQYYEKVVSGTWAPYALCGYSDVDLKDVAGPAWNKFSTFPKLSYLASVDIVFTSDKSKWTRCPVIELCEEAALSEGGAGKMDIRKSLSVDKDGKKATPGSGASTNPNDPNYISETGMGWFPGYAINLETGERLNMAFGEDSWLVADNGRDMKWNPTTTLFATPSMAPVFGGKHYIYVFGHNADGQFDVPRYDAGQKVMGLMSNTSASNYELVKRNYYEDAMWVNIPLLIEGRSLLETDVKVGIRIAQPYKRGYTGLWGTKAFTNPADPVLDTAVAPQNANMPLYAFNTYDIATHTNDADLLKDAINKINIVPNPYYAYSQYETSQLSNIVKLTNLPEKCTIKIYTLNGTLIRTYKKDEAKTSLDWDLKNQAGIPISSGLYVIHVDVPGVGEKIMKWFGVMRPIDLDSF